MLSAVYSQWKFEVPILSLCVNRNGDWVVAALADGTARLLPASDEAINPKPSKCMTASRYVSGLMPTITPFCRVATTEKY